MLCDKPMNISLTPRLEEYVRQRVASGMYNNASEVVREALRLFFEHPSPRDQATPHLDTKQELLSKLAALQPSLRERGITSVSLFGSRARGTAAATSDIDLLVQIAARKRFSLVDLASVKNFLEEQLGHPVDVVTKEGLDPHIRDRILGEARRVF